LSVFLGRFRKEIKDPRGREEKNEKGKGKREGSG